MDGFIECWLSDGAVRRGIDADALDIANATAAVAIRLILNFLTVNPLGCQALPTSTQWSSKCQLWLYCLRR